ncbi:hypothetical protein E2C01_097460 [Portunus trituberculatus]|uniref:Uncharacterized protein n=1 Tax=Portunus trituberculatus TaxID=210409 RepID=A0A5B7JYJ6_PORTR|nr:hypothetical protein [Portunus trituberculatus]
MKLHSQYNPRDAALKRIVPVFGRQHYKNKTMSEENVKSLKKDEQEELKSYFLGLRQGLVAFGPNEHLLPPQSVAFTKKYRDFRYSKL